MSSVILVGRNEVDQRGTQEEVEQNLVAGVGIYPSTGIDSTLISMDASIEPLSPYILHPE